jgi:hypothetical protein
MLQQAGMEDKHWQILGGDVRLSRFIVKKLAELKGTELKQQLEHLLMDGTLPRAERSGSRKASNTTTPKTRATAIAKTLKSKDEKLPVEVLKAMGPSVGLRLSGSEGSVEVDTPQRPRLAPIPAGFAKQRQGKLRTAQAPSEKRRVLRWRRQAPGGRLREGQEQFPHLAALPSPHLDRRRLYL